MSDVKCAQMLMEASKRDVEALRGMSNASVFADEIFGFHVQQAAEKLFKAWLALLGETYPLTHDLELLFNRLQERGVAASIFVALIEYAPYAVQFRYESIGVDAEPIDRQESLGLVEYLLAQVQLQFKGVEGT
jgi:HEPN domain-containing protein